jgi:hypothetical protein
MVNGFKGNGEKGFTKGGNNGPLARNIMSLEFQSEFGEVEGLREYV